MGRARHDAAAAAGGVVVLGNHHQGDEDDDDDDDESNNKKPNRRSTRNWIARFVLLVVLTLVAVAGLFSFGHPSPDSSNQRSSLRSNPPPLVADGAETTALLAPITITKPRLKIAVAVTVTRDGPYLDGAAVLQHSVRMTNSHHDISMVAIVHQGVTSTRPALRKLGFEIIEFEPPIKSSEIRGKHLRETIDSSGCCGAMELLKLCAWRLTQFDRVLAMDMDTIFMQSLDFLFEKDLPPGGVMFTYDHAMDGRGSRAPPVQGGFLLLRPSEQTYHEMVEIVREGDFRPSKGWAGSGIGWCWGGQTIQGLVSYYVNLVQPGLAFVLDPCEYNSMATTKECAEKAKINEVKSIHYTVCQKPWECRRGANTICATFLHAWWMVRDDLERAQGLPVYGRCCGVSPSPICPNRKYKAVDQAKLKPLSMRLFPDRPTVSGPIVIVPSDLPHYGVD